MKTAQKYIYLTALLAVFLFSGCAAYKVKQRIKTDYSKYSSVKFYFLEHKTPPDENAQKFLDAMAESFVDYIRRFGIKWRDLSKNRDEKAGLLIGVKLIRAGQLSAVRQAANLAVTAALFPVRDPFGAKDYIVNLKIADAEGDTVAGDISLITNAWVSQEKTIQELTMQFADFVTDSSGDREYLLSKDDEEKYFTEGYIAPGEKDFEGWLKKD